MLIVLVMLPAAASSWRCTQGKKITYRSGVCSLKLFLCYLRICDSSQILSVNFSSYIAAALEKQNFFKFRFWSQCKTSHVASPCHECVAPASTPSSGSSRTWKPPRRTTSATAACRWPWWTASGRGTRTMRPKSRFRVKSQVSSASGGHTNYCSFPRIRDPLLPKMFALKIRGFLIHGSTNVYCCVVNIFPNFYQWGVSYTQGSLIHKGLCYTRVFYTLENTVLHHTD